MSFAYDPVAHRFRDLRTGRFVPSSTMHEWIVASSESSGKYIRQLTQQLREGVVPLSEWQHLVAQEIKAGHLAAGMAAKGGRQQMTPSDYGRIGQILRQEYAFLGRLADGIADGSIPLDGRVLARAEQYGKASRETYENVLRREAQRRGADTERNVRGKTDSCEGCLNETARGWVPIGTLSLPGTRTCLSNCGCHIETRNSATGATFG